MQIDKERVAELLAEGFLRYFDAFGEMPHGTKNQMAALIELSKTEEWLKEDAE